MCAGGLYPSVRGQPPHRAIQYPLVASISLSRASASLARRRMTTLSGSASAMTARSILPRSHRSQYGFGPFGFATALPRQLAPQANEGKHTAPKACKQLCSERGYKKVTHHTHFRHTVCTASARPFADRYSPVWQKAGLTPRPLCLLPISGGAPSQGVRNLFGLSPGFAFAPRRTGQPFLATDLRAPSKAAKDHLAHSTFRHVVPAQRRSVKEQQ